MYLRHYRATNYDMHSDNCFELKLIDYIYSSSVHVKMLDYLKLTITYDRLLSYSKGVLRRVWVNTWYKTSRNMLTKHLYQEPTRV